MHTTRRAATVVHLVLAALVSAVLMLAPPRASAQCVNLAGNWSGSESGTVTLVLTASDGENDNETDPVSGSGDVTITQTGSCTFQYLPIALNGIGWIDPASAIRTVTVTGDNNVTETGIFVEINTALAAQEGCTINSVNPNVETGSGQVIADVLTLEETSNAVVTGSCSSGGQVVDFMLSITASTTAILFAENPPYTLSVTTVGSGSVRSTDDAIDCGTLCSYSYIRGTIVTLNAVPDPGSTFLGWSGACSGTGPCNLTMTQSQSVGATFTYPLTVFTVGDGTVTSTDGFIDCPETSCSHSYPPNTPVTLNAAPAPPSTTFSEWCGPCAGTGPCDITMTQAMSMGTLFTPVYVNLEPGGPYRSYFKPFGKPTSMYASFTPTDRDGNPLGLIAVAKACGFTRFDWRQEVNASMGGVWRHAPLQPLSVPYSDPPQSGYTYDYNCSKGAYYQCGKDKCPYPPDCDCTGLRNPWLHMYQPNFESNFAEPSPFYYSPLDVPSRLDVSSGCAVGNPPRIDDPQHPSCTNQHPGQPGCQIYMASDADQVEVSGNDTLNFWDRPGNMTCQPTERCFEFTTQLVGVCAASSQLCNLPTKTPSALLFEWYWKSNYNNDKKTGCVEIRTSKDDHSPPTCR